MRSTSFFCKTAVITNFTIIFIFARSFFKFFLELFLAYVTELFLFFNNSSFFTCFFDLHYLCKSLYQVCLLIITLSMFNGVFFPVAILSQLKILNLDRLLNLIKMLKYYVTCIQTIHTKYFWWWSVFCYLQLLKLSVSYKFEISTIVVDAGSGFVFPFGSAFGVSFNLLWRQFFCCFEIDFGFASGVGLDIGSVANIVSTYSGIFTW